MLPAFDERGVLPPGEYQLSFEELRNSFLVVGPHDREAWDRPWRLHLVDNLEILTSQLWAVSVDEIFAGGSFAEAKDRPNDIDGYFLCDRNAYKKRLLHRELNQLDPHKVWTWRDEKRTPDGKGRLKLPMWHTYRIELFPYYGQATTGFRDASGSDLDYPTLFRAKPGTFAGTRINKGIIKLIK